MSAANVEESPQGDERFVTSTSFLCLHQALVTMTPDQRRESISLSHTNTKEEKMKVYTLEEFSYDYFRSVPPSTICVFFTIC